MPYLEKILVSQKRNPKYYYKSKLDKIPKRYTNLLGSKYNFDSSGCLYSVDDNQRVIANPRSVGTPKYWQINNQSIYNGGLHPQVRAGYVNKIKDFIRPYLSKLKPFTEFPLRIELTIYSKEMKTDLDNKGSLFFKCFQDLLTKEGIIPDDSIEYITDTGRTIWIKSEEEHMEFKITEI